ncbi:TRIM7 ligase, partial [Trogon melanurus]|nr:TRIM7 ligase [Trogon melanurus]
PCVLASEAVASGRCCWDVEVAPEGSWALGVAKETTKPTEDAAAAMELWSMGRCQGQFWVLTSFER